MKTSELTGAALDWAVAKCEGGANLRFDGVACWWFTLNGVDRVLSSGWSNKQNFNPSTDWAHGGPIIEREGITVSDGSPVTGLEWMACDRGSTHIQHGPTYLTAAMRCYVASKLGDNIDISEGLT
jgi:hypothetical protein